MRLATFSMLFAVLMVRALAQTPSRDSADLRFDVVSIKQNRLNGTIFGNTLHVDQPNGGLVRTNTPVSTLVGEAYPEVTEGTPVIGLPDWAKTERYDIRATSLLSHATRDDRIAMLRAMLAERFTLAAHFENRQQPVFDLVLARRDRQLGAGLKPIDMDCASIVAQRTAGDAATIPSAPPAARQPTDFSVPPPACTFRTVSAFLRGRSGLGNTDVLEGTGTIDSLASSLRFLARRLVVNKTNLHGSFAVKMDFDMKSTLSVPATGSPSEEPSVFTALQEQLGLKLDASRSEQKTLIIDHLEHPTED